MVNIYRSSNIIFSTEINKGSKKKVTLMKEDYITLKFSVATPIYFQLGDDVNEDFGLYELIDYSNCKPSFNKSTGVYDYELRLDAYYWKWKNKIFKYTPSILGREESWNLTAALNVQMDVFLANLKALGYAYKGTDFTYSIDFITTVNGVTSGTVENKIYEMSYDSTNLIDALNDLCGTDKWNCKWWIEGSVIHFGKCESGDDVDFEIGVNCNSMTASESSSDFATRVYAFGSTKNITERYRRDLIFAVTKITDKTTTQHIIEDSNRTLYDSYFKSGAKSYGFQETQNVSTSDCVISGNTAKITKTIAFGSSGITGNDYEADLTKLLVSCKSPFVNSTVNVKCDVWIGENDGTKLDNCHIVDDMDFTPTSTDYTKSLSDVYFNCGNVTYNGLTLIIEITATVSGREFGSQSFLFSLSGSFTIKSEYQSAATKVIFFTGSLKGNTYDATYNPNYTSAGSNQILLPDGITPAVGDTYQLSNLMIGAVPVSYLTKKEGSDLVTNGVLTNRLMLPESCPYIDAKEGMSEEEIVERVLVYENIFPQMSNHTISDVSQGTGDYMSNGVKTGETYPIYTVTDKDLDFSNDYIIPGSNLMITFQTGLLAGLSFHVKYTAIDGGGSKFEILHSQDYGRYMPDEKSCPAVGDEYILYNYDASYIDTTSTDEAEQQLLTQAKADAKKLFVEASTYDCEMDSEIMKNSGNPISYGIGQKVKLINSGYFEEGYRESRVIGYEINLDIPYDSPTYTIGESATYNRLGDLQTQIDELQYNGKTYTSSGSSSSNSSSSSSGATVYIVTKSDSTELSDTNVLSSLRTINEIANRAISKQNDDTVAGVIDFTAGIKLNGDSISAIIKSTDSLDLSDTKVISAAKANDLFARKDVAGTFAEDMTFNKGINVAGMMKAAAATIVGIATIGTVSATTLNADTGTIPILNSTTATVSQTLNAGAAQITADLTVGGKTTTLNAVVNNLATTYQLSVSDTATILRTIVKDYISSDTYIPGFSGSGFKLWNNGAWNLELDTLTVRKVMNIFELIINKIRSVNGGLIVSPGNGKISSVSLANSVYTLGIEGDMTFVANDLVRCQTFRTTGSKYYWVQVQSVTDNNITVNQSDFGTIVPEVGDELVQMGNTTDTSRQGALYLVANEDGKPRIEALNGINSTDLTGKAKAVFGDLDGIIDTDFTSISGYGLYAENVYLKGSFILKSGKTIETAISDAIDGSSQTYVTQSTYSTEIKALTDSISAKVSQTDFNSLGDVVSGHTSTLSQLSDTIDARITTQVSSGGSIYNAVAASFTMSDNGISLFGKTINITGATIFSSLATQTQAQSYANNAAANGNTAYNQINWQYYDATVDLNNMTTTGKYMMRGTISNTPVSAWAYLVVEYADSSRITQTIWHDTDATNKYTRSYYGGTWGGWSKIANAADVSTAQSNAEGYTDSLKSSLGSLAYKAAVSAAMLDTTVINGGYILTSLIKASDLVIASGQITGLGSLATASSVSTSQITGLGGLALKDTIGKAQLDSTIISGAYISTSLLNVQEFVANGIWAQTINAGNATFSNITMTNASVTGTIIANAGTVGGFDINSTNLTSKYTGTMRGGTLSCTNTLTLNSQAISFNDTYNGLFVYCGSCNNVSGSLNMLTANTIDIDRSPYYQSSSSVGQYISVVGASDAGCDTNILRGNHALLIPNGDICGLRVVTRCVSGNTTLTTMDNIVLCSGGNCTITLPSNHIQNHVLWFIIIQNSTFTIASTTSNIHVGDSGTTSSVSIYHGQFLMMVYHNGYWSTTKGAPA